jgi:hypothetical protein
MPAKELLKYINNKKLLFSAIAVFISPFIVFAFWNFPSADDYMIIDKRNQFSFWELQKSVYQYWTGRYFATFVSSIFSYSGFLYSHYYFHTILLLVFTVLSWLFCLIQVNKHLADCRFSLSGLIMVSLLLLILELNIIPEPVTAFYWFSSAVTYQLPLIIMIFLAGITIKMLFAPFSKTFYLITASLLIIMLNGCNEIITLFVVINSPVMLAYFVLKKKTIPDFIIALYALTIITAGFLLLSPGILNRGSKMGEGSIISAVSFAFIKFLVLQWFFLKEPLWWFLAFCGILFFSNNRGVIEAIFKNVKKISLIAALALYIVTGLLIYVPVLYVTNGSLPLRAENIICFLYSLILLFVISIAVSDKVNSTSFSIFAKYRYLLLSLLIFSSGNLKNVTDSLLSGYFYSKVMKERLSLFENAKKHNEHEVTFDGYETAVNKKIKGYPLLNRQALKSIILRPPPIICFGSDVYDLNYMKEFYGIRKLNIPKN